MRFYYQTRRRSMNSLFVLFILVVLGKFSTLNADETTTSSSSSSFDHVVTLTADNFQNVVEQDPGNALWFLKLYAPWCSHCKTLAPILEKVAPHLQGKMAIGKMDCTSSKNKPLCGKDKFHVKGYPTIKIYRDGTYTDYQGERSADAIITFGERMSQDPIQLTSNKQHAIDVVGKHCTDNIVFVAYDPSSATSSSSNELNDILQSTKLLQVYKQVARMQQANACFAYIPNHNVSEQTLKEFGIMDQQKPFVAKIEQNVNPIIFNDVLPDPTTDSLLDFIKLNNHALVTNLGGHNFRQMGQLGKLLLIGVINSADLPNESQTLIQSLTKYAKQDASDVIHDKYLFCTMDGKKYEKFLQQFKIEKSNLPELFVLKYETKEFWSNTDLLSLDEFITAIEQDDIQPQQAQQSSNSNNPLLQFVDLFKQTMPYSAIFMLSIFVITYFAFLPDEKWEQYFGGNNGGASASGGTAQPSSSSTTTTLSNETKKEK